MKNRRNHSSKEAEYFFKIGFKAINDVNEFCGVMNRLEKFVISTEVRSGTFAVDARSLMGIFSLNLNKPVEVWFKTDTFLYLHRSLFLSAFLQDHQCYGHHHA